MLIGIREALVLNCSRPALLGRVLATQPPCTRPLSPPCRGGVPTGPRPPAPLHRGGRLRGAGSAPILQRPLLCHGAGRMSGEDEEKRRGRKAPSLSSSGHSLERGQNGRVRVVLQKPPQKPSAPILPTCSQGLFVPCPHNLCAGMLLHQRGPRSHLWPPAPGTRVGASCEQVMGPGMKGKLPGSPSVAW